MINKDGAHPISNGLLATQVSALVKTVKTYEQYTIESAVEGSCDKAILALVNNPLVHSVLDGIKAFDKLLEAHKAYLSRF